MLIQKRAGHALKRQFYHFHSILREKQAIKVEKSGIEKENKCGSKRKLELE
jgi:hypothetical protein